MVKRTGPTNVRLRILARSLRKAARQHKAPIWRAVSELLMLPTRSRIAINVSRINRYAKEGETVVIPGKVLGAGKLTKKVRVAAFAFSKAAQQKIEAAGGECLSIEELVQENPKGSGVRIMR
ncbi:MAG: 50S ribosomal protein L18e [Candidatus Verstraetearchaeota archaeon]|nr:50S ribosomal protein L18e [Candidatus Verstraetearchaeota archaeon]